MGVTLPRLSLAALLVGAVSLPFMVSAQTNAELQARVQTLLEQVAQLQQQLGLPSGGGTPAAGSVSSSVCPILSRILKPGMEGSEITALQRFLAADKSVYPEGLVTGYYGNLTTAAVQRWQAKYGVVSSGTPETTGYGQIGPRTAAAIKDRCGGAGPVAGGFINVSPVSGQAPLNVTVQATVNTVDSCEAAIYVLTWGDTSAPQNIPVPSGTCKELQQTFTHTYVYGSTYLIRLASGGHQTTATVVVSGLSAPQTVPTNPVPVQQPQGAQLPPEKFEASVKTGNVPLVVRFTGILNTNNSAWQAGESGFNTLDFGDGTDVRVPLPQDANSAHSFSVDHTYVRGGAFEAVLYQGPKGSARRTGESITVTTSGDSSASLPAQKFEATPTSGNTPLTVSFSGVVNSENESWCASGCNNTLDFGDGTSAQVPLPMEEGSAQSFTARHTYTSGGTYTAKLYQGSVGAPLIGSPITVIVTGSNPSIPLQSFSGTPTSGTAPFSVSFSGVVTGESKGWCASGCASTLDFGDSTSAEVPLPVSQSGSNSFTAQHTYVQAGTYQAILYQDGIGDGNAPVGTVVITVSADPINSYQYGTVAVTVAGPKSITVQFDLPTSCTGFDLGWGDGTAPVSQGHGSACAQTPSTKSYTHQYLTGGTFTITLKRGSTLGRVDTASLSIAN